MTLHFSAQYLEHIVKHYIAWAEIFISQGIVLLAQLFHSRVGDPSFRLSFLKDLISLGGGRAHGGDR